MLFISGVVYANDSTIVNKRCQGMTKTSDYRLRCGNTFNSMVVDTVKFCYLHNPNAIKCSGINKNGANCARTLKLKGYCGTHKSQSK